MPGFTVNANRQHLKAGERPEENLLLVWVLRQPLEFCAAVHLREGGA